MRTLNEKQKQLEFLEEFKKLLEKYDAHIARDYFTDFIEIRFNDSSEDIFIGSCSIYLEDLEYAIQRLQSK